LRRAHAACASALAFRLHAVEKALHVQSNDVSVHDLLKLSFPALFPREQFDVWNVIIWLFRQRHDLDGLQVFYAAVYAVEVCADDGEQAASARDGAFDVDKNTSLLRIGPDEREVVFEFEYDARAPARRVVAQHVRA